MPYIGLSLLTLARSRFCIFFSLSVLTFVALLIGDSLLVLDVLQLPGLVFGVAVAE